jgi:hypothetical protein
MMGSSHYPQMFVLENIIYQIRFCGGLGQIIGKFRGQIGETMRLDTLARQSDAEGGFCDFRGRRSPQVGFYPVMVDTRLLLVTITAM